MGTRKLARARAGRYRAFCDGHYTGRRPRLACCCLRKRAPITALQVRTRDKTAMAAATVIDADRTAYPTYCGWFTELSPVVGAAVALVVAFLYGRPTHVIITTPVLAILTGLGISLGYHRLFAHRSFATHRSV